MSDLVGNPEDRFSHDAAQIVHDTRNKKIQEFYSPILGPARAYKDDAHERREIQTIEWKRVLAITMYDIFVSEI